jgi:hypothetical protein
MRTEPLRRVDIEVSGEHGKICKARRSELGESVERLPDEG